MLNLLIVDDEADIADSLYMHFKQIEGMELDVYKTYSAKEALEWLNRTKIDIVLSDIRMPGMSGLQLMDIIKVKWPKCKIVFLTGYNEFDYIYKAAKTEGVRYLLKTEGYEEIVNAVQKAANEIESSIEINEMIDNARTQMSLALPLLQKELMLDLLNDAHLLEKEREQQFEDLKIQLDASMPVLLLAGRINNYEPSKNNSKRLQALFSVKLISEQFLSTNVKSYYAIYDRMTLIWIIQPKESSVELSMVDLSDSWKTEYVFVKGMLENIQAACKATLDVSLSFAIDNTPASWEEISERFNHLKQLLNYRIGAGAGELIIDDDFLISESETLAAGIVDAQKLYQQLKKIKELETFLENGQKDQFVLVMEDLVGNLKVVQSKNHNPSLELFYSISIMFLSYINRWNLTEKIAFKIGLNKLTRADEHSSWKDVAEYFLQLADVIFNIQKKEEDNRAETAINRIYEYIDHHLGEDLSLVRLAEQVHFNPSYLSRLFKQVTGNNLLNYINEVRLAKSMELLGKSSLKISEIGAAVGYISAPYFTRFFKKTTNMSPQEYRDHLFNR